MIQKKFLYIPNVAPLTFKIVPIVPEFIYTEEAFENIAEAVVEYIRNCVPSGSIASIKERLRTIGT